MIPTIGICTNLIANPTTGDSDVSFEFEVKLSGEKSIEDFLLDFGEFDCVTKMVRLRRH